MINGVFACRQQRRRLQWRLNTYWASPLVLLPVLSYDDKMGRIQTTGRPPPTQLTQISRSHATQHVQFSPSLPSNLFRRAEAPSVTRLEQRLSQHSKNFAAENVLMPRCKSILSQYQDWIQKNVLCALSFNWFACKDSESKQTSTLSDLLFKAWMVNKKNDEIKLWINTFNTTKPEDLTEYAKSKHPGGSQLRHALMKPLSNKYVLKIF